MTDYTKAHTVRTDKIKNVKLTTFPSRGHQPIVVWEFPEFQCLCPVSKRIDQGIVRIIYKPSTKILESKSVRDYLVMWRDKKIWQEYVTERIADDLFNACEAEWLTVEIKWSPRGGIFARTVARKFNKSY